MAGERLRVIVDNDHHTELTIDCWGNIGGSGWTAQSNGLPRSLWRTFDRRTITVVHGPLVDQWAEASIEVAGGLARLMGLSGFRW